ncbi:GNAT family N-acetyltransferase [Streptomyces sp. ALI-76-A]|uniref:GNAT family N-acetyltransferase n=1 Tax=Streptomyces sp. ALI-76-A TaxID=3025736 RepID=UPI00256F4C03|nr:GNAT family N-acetyltransferase [Streptomyces sp. ALI-76-A]MDL5205760.1 GNAT family N-acetyltransferase [Streptomyces sp. ALI-76-A]
MSSFLSPTDVDLCTDRLVLRPWSGDDVTAVLHGTRLAHWAEDFPAEGDRVIAGLLAEHPEWLGTYGHRLVVERHGGRVIGSAGLFWPPTQGALEIGYGIVATRRGHGYAAEATRALTEFALTAPEVHTVLATVETTNPASVRVLHKAGFRQVGTEEGMARYRFPAEGPTQP